MGAVTTATHGGAPNLPIVASKITRM